MATSESELVTDRKRGTIPPALFNACFALLVINVCYFPVAYVSGMWIWGTSGLGIPTDFVNVWAAGALAYDWDIQKQVELALLGQDFPGYFAWHYPPPFLFVASLLAMLPYSVAFIGWMAASLVPYLAVVRGIVSAGRLA
jgi:arabinofuranan 3-O-arabinosyltransferase